MTIKEAAFFQCAFMILHDQCPPERKHYLCMTEEDDSVQDCIQCWSNYLRNLTMGYIEIPSQNDILPALKYGIFPRRLYKTDGERC